MSDAELSAAFREARQNHIAWRDRQRASGDAAPHVGGAAWHERWIAIYDAAIARLAEAVRLSLP